jgi:hypothetical protein
MMKVGRDAIMMPVKLEARLAILEAEVERLKSKVEAVDNMSIPWWERIAGTFADDPHHEKAMTLGRSYRESLRPGKPKVRKR